MDRIRKIIRKISDNTITRNFVLAFCAVAVFVGLAALALTIFTRHNQHKPVPDFIGVHIPDVLAQAQKAGLQVEILDSVYAPVYGGGAVIEQIPTGGTEVKRGRRIFVTITSHQQKMVSVPYVTGYSLRQAKNMIEMAGLEIRELRYVPNIATNNILAQLNGRDTIRLKSGLQLEMGSGVTLVVGLAADAEWVDVPKVVGLPLSEAKSRLWERGLNVGEITRDEGINLVYQKNALVYRQSPSYGHIVALGTKVSIALTLDEARVGDGNAIADRDARRIIQEREAGKAARQAEEGSAIEEAEQQ